MVENYKLILKNFISKKKIDELEKILLKKNRTNIIYNKLFIKVGINKNDKFFKKLVEEINFYRQNINKNFLPKILFTYYDNNIVILIEKKIEGKTLNDSRNKLYLESTNEIDIKKVLKSIEKIKNYNFQVDNTIKYKREEKIEKYLDNLKEILDKKVINTIEKNMSFFKTYNFEYVNSHGDLIPANIFYTNKKILFIDWEYAGLKPKYYDLIYFMLFSIDPRKVIKLIHLYTNNKLIINEMLKDAICICLREIKNWYVIKNLTDLKEKYISIWKEALATLLELLKK